MGGPIAASLIGAAVYRSDRVDSRKKTRRSRGFCIIRHADLRICGYTVEDAKPVDASPQEFRALVERHQGRVFSIAYRILGESGVAEEVAQDVFLELHRNLPRLASEEHATAWLRRVACHRATDALRRRAARGDVAAEEYQDGMALRPVVRDFMPLMNRVEQLLLTLPPPQRAVMLLRYQEDLEPEDIALELKMPLATVRSYLQRAVKTLRAKADRTLKEYSRG
jgi:RNA polymerase sigma-70 factor (ECF subfamily)